MSHTNWRILLIVAALAVVVRDATAEEKAASFSRPDSAPLDRVLSVDEADAIVAAGDRRPDGSRIG